MSQAEESNLVALAELLDEANINNLIMKAEILRELGRFDEAVSLLKEESEKKFTRDLRTRSVILWELGRFNKFSDLLDKESGSREIFNIVTFIKDLAMRGDRYVRKIEFQKLPIKLYDVVMVHYGADKIAMIKALRNLIGDGLKPATDIVNMLPSTVKTAVSLSTAIAVKKTLSAVGAKVQVWQHPS